MSACFIFYARPVLKNSAKLDIYNKRPLKQLCARKTELNSMIRLKPSADTEQWQLKALISIVTRLWPVMNQKGCAQKSIHLLIITFYSEQCFFGPKMFTWAINVLLKLYINQPQKIFHCIFIIQMMSICK